MIMRDDSFEGYEGYEGLLCFGVFLFFTIAKSLTVEVDFVWLVSHII